MFEIVHNAILTLSTIILLCRILVYTVELFIASREFLCALYTQCSKVIPSRNTQHYWFTLGIVVYH